MFDAKYGELQVAAQVWRIEGYNGDRLVMSETLSFAAFSEKEIVTLLQRLASKHLADHEIISASHRKNSVGYGSALEPKIDRSGTTTIMVGADPHFAARLTQSGENKANAARS